METALVARARLTAMPERKGPQGCGEGGRASSRLNAPFSTRPWSFHLGGVRRCPWAQQQQWAFKSCRETTQRQRHVKIGACAQDRQHGLTLKFICPGRAAPWQPLESCLACNSSPSCSPTLTSHDDCERLRSSAMIENISTYKVYVDPSCSCFVFQNFSANGANGARKAAES